MRIMRISSLGTSCKPEKIRAILATATEGASKAEIKRSANLNFIQINRYIDFMLRQDLLSPRIQPNEAYLTTQKGRDFLNTSLSALS